MQEQRKDLTKQEALGVDISAARYFGMSKQDLVLFNTILQHFIQRITEKQTTEGGGHNS